MDEPSSEVPSTMSHARRFWATLAAALLILPATATAALDPTDVLQIQATTSFVRDNNLFRLPDVDPLLFGIDPARKSDTTTIKGVGIKVDKLLSRQRLIADLNLSEQTYDKNANLDFFGGDGRLAWLWQVGNHWNGEASYRKRRTLGGFSDFRQNVQDLIDTETLLLSGGFQFHPRWRASADLQEQDSSHSASSRTSLDFTSHTVGLEVRYRTPSQNSLGVQARRTDRSYPNRTTLGLATLDNGHTEFRLGAVGLWQVTGLWKLEAQFGRVDVQHDLLTRRDFSGVTWRAGATWDPTTKVRVNLTTTKDVRLYEDIATSYIVLRSIGVSPSYVISQKLILQGDVSYERRSYQGDPGFVVSNIHRDDTIRMVRIGLTYAPIRNLDLSLTYEVGDRTSNLALNNFEYRNWLGTLRIGF